MPNRILRDWTDSERINKLSFQAETLFVRLMMKADDLGSYHANPRLIKAYCFPLKQIRETDITRWLQELASAGIIAFYTADNKPYLHIVNFGQRLRQVKPKHPQISKKELDKFMSDTCRKPVSNMSATCRPETETEVETEVEENDSVEDFSPKGDTPKSFKKLSKDDFYNSLKPFVSEYGKELVREFFDYWTEPSANGTLKFQLEKTWDTARRLSTWKRNETKFGTSKPTNEPPKRRRNEF